MKTTDIQSYAELENAMAQNGRSFLFIYRKGSEQSECALNNILQVDPGNPVAIFTVDVSAVRDVHPRFGIDTAPSLLLLQQGKAVNIIKGCRSASFYESVFKGRFPNPAQADQQKRTRQVTVYSTPTCSWCNTLKTYLKTRGVSFREVNVAADQGAAEAMVKKSGQQGVPQTEIDGQIIVGFDRERIDQLLNIQ